jgi:two-component system, NarL family, response regulator DegU
LTIRLMLVDDHSVLRQGMRRTFEEEGYDVVAEANDGNEAIRLAAQFTPDVIVMDVSMPGMDGVEATRRIVAANPNQRIVMLTMHIDHTVMDNALKAGAIGYITKDCTSDEIIDIVKQAADPNTFLSPLIAQSMLNEAKKTASSPSAKRKCCSSSLTAALRQRLRPSCTSARRRSRTTWQASTTSSTPVTAPKPCSSPCVWAS